MIVHRARAGALMALVLFFHPAPAAAFCWRRAADLYRVPPLWLWAIAKVESSFDPEAVNTNSNGSADYGLMQINSSWQAKLGEERWTATLSDPCYNVMVGAWLLDDCLSRYGHTWEGLGCYNAISPDKRAKYAEKLIHVINSAIQATNEARHADNDP